MSPYTVFAELGRITHYGVYLATVLLVFGGIRWGMRARTTQIGIVLLFFFVALGNFCELLTRPLEQQAASDIWSHFAIVLAAILGYSMLWFSVIRKAASHPSVSPKPKPDATPTI